ncbi:MAG: alpha-galactosidase [bacterium]
MYRRTLRSITTFLFLAFITECLWTQQSSTRDWLLTPRTYKAQILKTTKNLTLTNGLISRRIQLSPNAATVDYRNLMTGDAIIRAIQPEGVLVLNGSRIEVGGLKGQVEKAYLKEEWLDALTTDSHAFQFTSFSIGETHARFPYARKRWGGENPWPPHGKSLVLEFHHTDPLWKNITVSVHYEIYDGIPLLTKWLTVKNGGKAPVRLNSFISELLAIIEPEVAVDSPPQWDPPNIHVESEYAFLGMTPKTSNKTTFLVTDSTFTSQVNYQLKTPCILESRLPLGPDVDIQPGATFETFRTYELIFDSYDRERKGLAVRKLYRAIAPWIMENPIFLHLTSTDPVIVKRAVDQCVDVGFEMIILSFGSGLNMESADPASITKMKELVDYAHSKGIEMGGYSLLASRRINDEQDVINPQTGRTGGAIFGNSPCLGSEWGIDYFKRVKNFIEKTGFDILEHDGSYPGDLCASTKHPGHEGLNDSQWKQWRQITEFYHWCRERNVYLNVPDWYFLNGSNKTGIGYREVNWSLPRERQIMLGRQNLYDGTWQKTPSMGWTFVPLVQYQGGGAAATIEPLSEHLAEYQAHLVQNFGAGVQACYRGPRLFDTDSTKALVKKWVDWYKKYRKILNSDIIHIRRPDGRDLDAFMHLNPSLKEKGMLMIFNPTGTEISKTLKIPLYYTGLTTEAKVSERAEGKKPYKIDRQYNIELPVKVQANGINWYVIE